MRSEVVQGGVGRVVLASAGTGKTYQLTSRYLQLMANGAPPESILATTFTRKAAGEIFDRLARRLLHAGEETEAGRAALSELRKSVHPGLDASACVGMLATLAECLHRLHIRTIDSFFVQAALVNALELDMPPGWRIVEDDEDREIRFDVIDRVLELGDREELVALIRVLHGGAFARSVQGSLLRAINGSYSAYLQSVDQPEAWRVAAPEKEPLSGADVARAIGDLVDAPLPTTGSGQPHKTWVKAHEKAIEFARTGDWGGFLETGIAERVVSGEDEYCRLPVTQDVFRAYRPLIDHGVSIVLDTLDRRNRATRDFLRGFDREYLVIKHDRGAYRFDDIPRLLLERITDGGLDDLYYRLDGCVRHLLLDEFQDTSIAQFRLLRPMLEEIVADPSAGRSVFCVGDVKQSLYGWRDAEPELLRRLPEIWPQLGDPLTLEHSYRSSPIVLETVNEVFSALEGNGAIQAPEAAAAWARRFRRHEVVAHLRDLPGEVALRVGPSADGNVAERLLATLEYGAARVRALRDRCGAATIGVLVRKRDRIPLLIHALDRLGVEASEEGGNPVTDAPGVAAATSLLWMADHPGDSAARYHVATSPIGVVVGLTDPRDDAGAERVAAQLRSRLSRDGYAPTLSAILADCTSSIDGRGFDRFCQLIDLAQRFDEHAGTRPAEFVRLVRTRGVEEPGRRQVRVMTVHAAKGLEFDAVILPDLDEEWRIRPGDMLVEREEPLGPITGVSLYANEKLRSISPRLRSMYERCLADEVGEELCVLYVAMTRAVHVLEMIVQARDGAGSRRSAAGVLIDSLAPGSMPSGGADLWVRSSGDWAAHVSGAAHDAAPDRREPIELVLRRPKRTGSARLQRRSPSALEGGQRLDLAGELRLADGGALDRGTLMHAWFEAIEWIEDGIPDESALLGAARAASLDMDLARGLLPDFARAVAGESVRAALSQARYSPRIEPGDRLEVLRESAFAVRDEHGELGEPWLLTGRFDRLVVGCRSGEAQWAEVIDFKTDDVAPDDLLGLASRVDYYRPQIQSYRRAAAGVLRIPLERVGARLVFTSCDHVVDVGEPS